MASPNSSPRRRTYWHSDLTKKNATLGPSRVDVQPRRRTTAGGVSPPRQHLPAAYDINYTQKEPFYGRQHPSPDPNHLSSQDDGKGGRVRRADDFGAHGQYEQGHRSQSPTDRVNRHREYSRGIPAPRSKLYHDSRPDLRRFGGSAEVGHSSFDTRIHNKSYGRESLAVRQGTVTDQSVGSTGTQHALAAGRSVSPVSDWNQPNAIPRISRTAEECTERGRYTPGGSRERLNTEYHNCELDASRQRVEYDNFKDSLTNNPRLGYTPEQHRILHSSIPMQNLQYTTNK